MSHDPEAREAGGLRPVVIRPDVLDFALGSAEIAVGRTRVLCAASVEDRIPPWLAGRGRGWVTAEYSMLPASTPQRKQREGIKGKLGGRTMEIQRLIGRSLRAVARLDRLGERQLTVDCDVLQADGGTRCASITGGYVALALALRRLVAEGVVPDGVLADSVAALSVGLKDDRPVVDLDYALDSTADVDANFVVTGAGRLVEVQATAEHGTFDPEQLAELTRLAMAGCQRLAELQAAALDAAGAR